MIVNIDPLADDISNQCRTADNSFAYDVLSRARRNVMNVKPISMISFQSDIIVNNISVERENAILVARSARSR